MGYHRKKAATDGENKLLFGILYSFQVFTEKTSPNPEKEEGGFRTFATSGYRLHQYASATGYRFVVNTDPSTLDLRDELKQLYGILVEKAIKNPLYKPNRGETITAPAFVQAANAFVKGLPCFL